MTVMKRYLKLTFMTALAAVTLTLGSCAARAGENDELTVGESWTVMLYFDGGGNLDEDMVTNIAEVFLADENDVINMTFQFKPTMESGKKNEFNRFNGVIRFDMAEQRSNVGEVTYDDNGLTCDVLAKLKPQVVGDASYDMGDPEHLADFISYSKNLHPADHYMLILSGHGSGYYVLRDGVRKGNGKQYKSTDYDEMDENVMPLENLIAGVKSPIAMGDEKLDVIYTDACLMATAENIAGYSRIADYFIGSEEVVPGMGADYTLILNLLGQYSDQAGEWGPAYVEYVIKNDWDESGMADIGIYSLSDIAEIMAPVQKLGEQLCNDYADEDCSEIINAAVTSCLSATNVNAHNMECSNRLKALIPEGEKGETTIGYIQKMTSTDEDFSRNFINAAKGDEASDLWETSAYYVSNNYTLADFMNILCENMPSDRKSVYKGIYDEYLQALDANTAIFCTGGDEMAAMKLTSMSITLNGMSEAALACDNCVSVLSEKDNLYSPYSNPSAFMLDGVGAKTRARQVVDWYRASDFDQMVGHSWSNFLSMLEVNPGLFSNPSRETLKR